MNLSDPEKTVFYQIERAIKQYRSMAQGNLNALGFNVTINQILLLIQVNRRPEISQIELAELLFKDVASITRMIALLIKEGILTREENTMDRMKRT